MGMFIPIIDPSLNLAHIILVLTIAIALWKWISHNPEQELPEGKNQPPLIARNSLKGRFFRYLLTVLYPILIGVTLAADYPFFSAFPLAYPLRQIFTSHAYYGECHPI